MCIEMFKFKTGASRVSSGVPVALMMTSQIWQSRRPPPVAESPIADPPSPFGTRLDSLAPIVLAQLYRVNDLYTSYYYYYHVKSSWNELSFQYTLVLDMI